MLQRLEIRDFAIIEHLEIEFGSGFCVLTGETGAGKSIIMGALNSVMGGKMEARSLREGAKKCVIEAAFSINRQEKGTNDDEDIEALFERLDLEFDEETIIRRELNDSGKSRAFVNDSPTTLSALKELGERLIDIHSQHANLLVRNKGWQLQTLDTMAGTLQQLLPAYQEKYRQWKTTESDLKKRIENRDKNSNERDYIAYQLEELQKAQLKEGEQDLLEERQRTLSHAEDTRVEIETTSQLLNDDTSGVVTLLQKASESLRKAAEYNPAYGDLAERSKSCYIEVKDIANEVESEKDSISYDPLELQKTEERLDTIYSLEKKHGVDSVEALLKKQAEWNSLLNNDENSDEEIERLKKQVETLRQESETAAQKLSEARQKNTQTIEEKIVEMLRELGMKDVRMKIALDKTELNATGQDNVEFLFSANAKNGLRPIADIASGGEIARVMLTLKAMLAEKAQLPTIVFDEIDTGISGEVADKTGRIMRNMASSMQVICITHLPQIAAQGETHYRVHKENSNTAIDRLNDAQRVEEIAQMLSGSNVTDAARKNAEELISAKRQ